MKRLLVLVAVLSAASAEAKDMNGKFGLGFSQTLGGVSGIDFRYWATRRFGIDTTVGVSFFDRDSLRGVTDVRAAAGFLYSFLQSRHANLSVAARLDVAFRTVPADRQQTVRVGDAVDSTEASRTLAADETTWQFNIEVPFVVEYFFSDAFSVNVAVGFVMVIVPSAGGLLESSGPGATVTRGEIGYGIGAGGLLGSAGFSYYF